MTRHPAPHPPATRSRGAGRRERRPAVAGDRAFERLVAEHHRAVFTYARSMTGCAAMAEDATQETFLRAWKYLDSFRGTGSREGWLIRICRRCVLDLLDRERSHTVSDLRPHHHEADHRPEVWLALASLSPDHREVLTLCGVLGYDYETSAAVLDLPTGTVRSRLHRARAALREALGDEAAG